jgi:hypothetical protein
MVQLGEDCDFDGTRLRENFVFMKKKLLSSREVFDGNSHHAVEIAVDLADL